MRSVATIAFMISVAGIAACGSDGPPATPVTPTATCNFTVNVGASQFAPTGGEVKASVTTSANCAWSASLDANWLAINGASSRTGEGAVTVKATAFDSTSERVATLTIAGQSFKLTQNGCTIHLGDSEMSFPGEGGTVDLRIDVNGACSWKVDGDQSWAALEPTSGSGAGFTRVRVNRNSSSTARTASLQIGGQSFAVRQAGFSGPPAPPTPPSPAACSYSVSPTEAYVPSFGGSGSVRVTAPAGCTWTATIAESFARITRGQSGTGSGEIAYDVDRNPETYVIDFRKIAVQVRWPTATAGQNVWLSQFGNCGAAEQAFSYNFPASGGRLDSNILVESPFRCPWRLEGGADWVSIISPQRNIILRGDGDLHATIAPNTTGQTRTTTLLVAERRFVVTQSGQ